MPIPEGLKRVAAMVVLRHQQKFMLLRRAKPPNQHKYVPVGGKLEPHEDPYSAAIRETQEETGIQLEGVRFCGSLIESSPVEYNWMCFIYLADIEDMLPPYCDEGQLEWIDFADLLEVPTPPTDWHIYQYLMAQRPFALNAVYDDQLNLLGMREEIEGRILVGPAPALPDTWSKSR